MKLYERFAEKNFHTSVATTFGIDFDAYESIVLSRLRGAGCRNNMVVTDGRMLTYALGGASALPQHAGTHYTVGGASAAGVFHPKVFLQFGRRVGRLIIGSANLTPSGLAGNLELAAEIRCDDADSGEQRLITQAWAYVSNLLEDDRQSIAGQVEWMQTRTRWLAGAVPANGAEQLSDGTLAALLTTVPDSGIAARFVDLIDEPISRLIIISPYWDPDLAALSYLIGRLSPNDVSLLIDPKTREFPKHAVSHLEGVTLYDRGSFREGRFIHAKTIIAQTESADHVLVGSANCTRAALGLDRYAGSNEEVCLYRRLPAGSVLTALGLGDVLTDDHRIEAAALDTPIFVEELPLDDLAQKAPGQFECRADTLIWHPPPIIDPQACTITLLDRREQAIDCAITALPGNDHSLHYQISGTEVRPFFARIGFPNGGHSNPAIVTAIDTLRMEIREPRSSSTQRKLDELDTYTEAHLALLAVINELEELELNEGDSKGPLSVPKRRKDYSGGTDPTRYKQLSYADFIKGRRPRDAAAQSAHNSLAGSDVSIVRGILNRIIGLTATDGAHDHDNDDNAAKHLLYRGDETSNPEGDINAGQEFPPEKRDPGKQEADEEKRRRRAMRRRATQEQIVKAAQSFQDRIKANRGNGGLTNNDLLRLRALLMVLCTAASPKAKGKESQEELRSRLRVLPAEGDQNSWPMVIGRLLFLLFGGNNPAIRHLHLTNEHDQIPGDFTECWATCYWCIQACLLGAPSKSERQKLQRGLTQIADTAFKLTLPSKEELLGGDVMKVMDQMSDTYAAQLDLNPAAITEGHRTMVTETFREEP